MIEALLGIVILVGAVVIAYAVLRLSGDDENASETNEEEELLTNRVNATVLTGRMQLAGALALGAWRE